jgi:hypothetical protein
MRKIRKSENCKINSMIYNEFWLGLEQRYCLGEFCKLVFVPINKKMCYPCFIIWFQMQKSKWFLLGCSGLWIEHAQTEASPVYILDLKIPRFKHFNIKMAAKQIRTARSVKDFLFIFYTFYSISEPRFQESIVIPQIYFENSNVCFIYIVKVRRFLLIFASYDS